jgi:general secretion pathway protein K
MGALLERCRTALRWRAPGDRGFILIVVISAIGILALVAASFAQITSSHVRAATSAVQSAGAEALADAGVQLAILDLVAARSGNGPPRQRFTTDGVAQTCDAGDGNWLAIAVQDEAGKVDVNVADERLIRALLRGLGVASSATVADALLDFRDADDNRRPQGAERAEYLAAGRAHGPKNAPLSVVDELEQVLGLSAADAARLRPHVTVYSGQSGIAPSAASPTLLSLLSRGLAPEEPAESSAPKEDVEPDDGPRQLPREFGGGAGGRVFSVRSEGHAGRAIFVREAIVEVASSRAKPFVLHRWHRGTMGHGAPLRSGGEAVLPRC